MRALAACLFTSVLALAQEPSRPLVQEAPLRAHLAFLADPLLEGRGTGQRGGDLAVRYLETQLRAYGLRPANGDSFLQPVEIQGVKLVPARSSVRFEGPGGALAPAFSTDLVASCGSGEAEVSLHAPVLFVGYGIQAEKERWDDYKGADCRGKLLVMLVNEPRPTSAEPGLFDGENLTEFGRWDWKFGEAARRGAAGVLLIHTTEGASYGWSVVQNGFQGERFRLLKGPSLASAQGWITRDFAARLFRAGGRDLEALVAAAQERDFRPVPLDLRADLHLVSEVRAFSQANVAGLLPGSDPQLRDEVVITSAHWDHLGIQGGKVYPGAVDNASACAALLAMAQASVGHPARRSLLFLFTCGEEQGLLGAEAYVQGPLRPLSRTVAALNLESLNWVGPSRDIEFLGGRRSGLLALGEKVAAGMGLALRPSEPDRQGLYFRSDHFPFAKAGIPALSPGFSLAGQRDYLTHPEASRDLARTYLSRYHQESDAYDPAWDLRGMVQQAQFVLNLGRALADGEPARQTGIVTLP